MKRLLMRFGAAAILLTVVACSDRTQPPTPVQKPMAQASRSAGAVSVSGPGAVRPDEADTSKGLYNANTDAPTPQPQGEFDLAPNPTGMRDLNSLAFSRLLGIGWNLGNALEAVDTTTNTRDETIWGNPRVNRQLLQAVADAGFKTVRLPVAWSEFSDPANFVIAESRMARVEQVVNDILDTGMYVMLNMHWDGGWMQPTEAQRDPVNGRLAIMWRQIANHFRDYDDRLLFAGTNEVMVEGDYGTPSPEYYRVQNSFNQTFVDAVRATGGRNAYRYLVIQGFNTNIDHTVNFATLPADRVDNRLLMEVHFYDPYEFALTEDTRYWQWGKIATDNTLKAAWPAETAGSDEAFVDSKMKLMEAKYIRNGIGVILGEYGAVRKNTVDPKGVYRTYWVEYVTRSAIAHGLVPVYWDNGYPNDDYSFGLFDRHSGAQVHTAIIDAIIKAAR